MVLVHALLDGDDTEVHVGTRAGTLEDGSCGEAGSNEVEVDRRTSEILYIHRAIIIAAAMRVEIERRWQISNDGDAVIQKQGCSS